MSEPYLSEIKIFAFNYPPKGWAFCNGQLLPINQNQALFALLGTMYGGNGQTNFALPDLRGRVAIHKGGPYTQGQAAGQEAHTLTIPEMPQHNHFVNASPATVNQPYPTGNLWAAGASHPDFGARGDTAMSAGSIVATGGSQAHENRSPFLTLNFCIALQGVFPSPN